MNRRTLSGLLYILLVLGMLAGCGSPVAEPEELGDAAGSVGMEDETSSSAPLQPSAFEEPEVGSEPEPETESSQENAPTIAQTVPANRGIIYGELDDSTGNAARDALYRSRGFGGERASRLGTQEELDKVKSFLSGLRADTVTLLVAEALPFVTGPDHALSDAEIAEIVGILSAWEPLLLSEEDFGNPYMGGGCSVLVEAPQGCVILGYSGWFTVEYPNTRDVLVFRADHAPDRFAVIWEYIEDKLGYVDVPPPDDLNAQRFRDGSWLVTLELTTYDRVDGKVNRQYEKRELDPGDSQRFADGFTFSRFADEGVIDWNWHGAGDYLVVTFDNGQENYQLYIFERESEAKLESNSYDGYSKVYQVSDGTWEAAVAYIEHFR